MLKGIVHPKMKIVSSFTHPQVVPNLNECLSSAEHKVRCSEECGKQSSSGAPLTPMCLFSYYGSQWCHKTAWLQTFFKISSFVRQNKEIHTGLELGWVNDDRYFIFGWTIILSRISSTHVKPIIMAIILLLFQLLFKIFSSFLSCIENDFILNNNNNGYYYWFFFYVWWESNLFLIFSNVSLFWGRSLTLTCPAQTSQSFSLFPVWDCCCCCCIWTTEQDLLTSHTQHNCCYSVLCAV